MFTKDGFLFEFMNNSAILHFETQKKNFGNGSFYCVVINLVREKDDLLRMILHYSEHKFYTLESKLSVTTSRANFKFLTNLPCRNNYGTNLFRKHVEKFNEDIIGYKINSNFPIHKLKYEIICYSVQSNKLKTDMISSLRKLHVFSSTFPYRANIYEVESKCLILNLLTLFVKCFRT